MAPSFQMGSLWIRYGPSRAESPGTRIESLRIDRVLGQGAFGVTYLVTDTVLDKSFALKEYLPRKLVRRDVGGSLEPVSDEAERQFAAGLAEFRMVELTVLTDTNLH